ncbi:DNA repair protein RecO [Candidatus Saccharibacteria bacterium]|nr:DNA repair protein RecO [Candidatus Saccharibacteria bacterium]
MRTIRTKAIVLRRTNYGEADRIVQFLTPDSGIMSVMAKGVRKEKSRLAGGIELFAVCDVTIGSGRGELGILTTSRLDVFYSRIMTDYDRLQFAYEVIKQIGKIATTIDEPAFFDLLEQSLISLNDMDIDIRLTKTWFWLQLAILLGVGLNLATDANGMKLVEDATYSFSEADHGFVFSERGTYTTDHIKLLRILSAQHPKVASHVSGSGALVNDCLWAAERVVAR